MTTEQALATLTYLRPRLTPREVKALEVLNRECAAVAFEAGRLTERSETVTGDPLLRGAGTVADAASLRADIISGLDSVAERPLVWASLSDQRKKELLAVKQLLLQAQPGQPIDVLQVLYNLFIAQQL